MPLNTTPLPYGLRDVKITGYTNDSATTLNATGLDLPNAQTFSFTDSEEFATLRGDDRNVTSFGQGPSVAWELDAGGFPFEAFQLMAGGAVTTTGTTPTQTKVMAKKVTDARPQFQTEGQVISASGGDLHCVLPRCKATGDLSGEFSDGNFFVTSASGSAYGSLRTSNLDVIYQFVQNETAASIPTATATVN